MREFSRANQLMVEKRASAGDSLEASRPIQHFVYFSDRIKCSAAEAAFRVAGFQTSSIHRTLKSQVIVSHEGKISAVYMNLVCEDINQITEHYGGEYAGWDAEIIRLAG